MNWQIVKVILAAGTISFASWLAGRQPKIAGFIMALPLSSMLALIFFQIEFKDSAKASAFAKSILTAVPLSLLFFVPFLLAPRWDWNFWTTYFLGVILLGAGFLAHRALF